MDLKKNNGKERRGFSLAWIYVPIILFLLYQLFMGTNGGDPVQTEWTDVKERIIPSGDVKSICFYTNSRKAEITLKKESLEKYKNYFGGKTPEYGPHFFFKVSENFNFEDKLDEAREALPVDNRFKIEISEEANYWKYVDWLIFPVILLVFWFLMFRGFSKSAGGGPGGVFNVGKSKAKVFDKDSLNKVTFKDVAGLEEAKVEVMEIVDFLKNPAKYTALGGKIPKGALLVGPPGTGKTLLAKAVAGEADVPFFSISGSDFVEMFVGVGASRVRDLFQQAKEKAPCIVFIDEIDAVGRARSKNVGFSSNDERENTLNQLLTEMDGFGTNSGVIILAATNRADILDKALMRAGRFDRQIYVDLPELKDREAIFDVHLKNLKLDPDLDRSFLAKHTPGFSGADIANVCNEAALIAARRNKTLIEKQDFLDAVDRIIGGLEKKSRIFKPEEKKTTAYHEAGHAVVSWFLKNADPVFKVTIIPRGVSLGATWYLPEERLLSTKEQLLEEMASLMGGRAAEEIINGTIATGALNDLERATKLAYAMVTYYGMSEKIGHLSYYDSQQMPMYDKPYSEQTAQLIDSEAKLLLNKAHETALSIIREHMDGFVELAELLISREVIFGEDLERIFGPRAVDAAADEAETAAEEIADESAEETVKDEPEKQETK